MRIKSLVVAEVYGSRDLQDLVKLTESMDKYFDLLAISSVYELGLEDIEEKKYLNYVRGEGLCTMFSIESDYKLADLIDKIYHIKQSANEGMARRKINLELLYFGERTSFVPSSTIPHPEAHKNRQWLIAASELWPNYKHPVLLETLTSLARDQYLEGSDFFFAQGKSLLDF